MTNKELLEQFEVCRTGCAYQYVDGCKNCKWEEDCNETYQRFKSLLSAQEPTDEAKVTMADLDTWAEQLFITAQEAIDKGICWSTHEKLIPVLSDIFKGAGCEVEETE